jgi:hypothetical protein
MGASTVAVGIEGGEEFATAADLRPSETLILLIDAADDVPGACGRRQNDVRAALGHRLGQRPGMSLEPSRRQKPRGSPRIRSASYWPVPKLRSWARPSGARLDSE